jgi:hypothetical protein
MRPEAEDRQAGSWLPPAPQAPGRPHHQSDPDLEGDAGSHVTPDTDRRHRAATREPRHARSRNPRWIVDRSSADPKAKRGLGLLEILLLALVALGVAITIAMAVIDPAA